MWAENIATYSPVTGLESTNRSAVRGTRTPDPVIKSHCALPTVPQGKIYPIFT